MSDIAAELKAGKLTPEAAVEKAMSRVIEHQLGQAGAGGSSNGSNVRTRVEAALRDALESDPVLSEKLRSLRS